MLRELMCAELDRLHALTALDFAKSVVDYNTARIRRLESCIRSQA